MIEGSGENREQFNAPDEEQAEGEKFPTLVNRKGEQRIVRSAEEATALVTGSKDWERGNFYLLGGTNEKLRDDLLKSIGLTFAELYKISAQHVENARLALNKDREILYLQEGSEQWHEAVRNYHYFNRLESEQRKERNPEEDFPPLYAKVEGLEAEVLEKIETTIVRIAHYIGKDSRALLDSYGRFNKSLLEQHVEFEPFNAKNLYEAFCLFDYYFNYSDGMNKKIENVMENHKPKKVMKYEKNPLLSPFTETCRKLQAEGAEHIPAWLAEQANMAGTSAVFSDAQEFMSQFVKDMTSYKERYEAYILQNKIENTPAFPVEMSFITNFEKMSKEISRVGKPKGESAEE